MPWWGLLIILFSALLVLLFLGLPIAFSLGFVSIVMALIIWWPDPFSGFYGIALSGFNEMTNYLLVCVPLFILLAELMFRSGAGEDTYEVIHRFLSGLPGGLGMAAVVFGMVFGAVCGASTAGTATVGLLSIPEMKRRGYEDGLNGSLVAFAGALSILIPPSVIFILYGVLAAESIGDLFMGGVFPGVIATALACIYIGIVVRLNPSLAPRAPGFTAKEKFSSLWRVWAILLVIVVLLGSIYMGVATPTEASAVATALVFIIAGAQRRLNWKVMSEALLRTMRTTAMIGWIIIGAMAFGYIIIRSGAAGALTEWIVTLAVPTTVVIIGLMLMYLIMGMFIDPAAIVMMTTPILMPVFMALQIDTLWFGVLLVINMCAGNITPPMALNLYIVKGISDIDMAKLFRAAWPFVAIDVIVILLVLFFPQLATWLPSTMH